MSDKELEEPPILVEPVGRYEPPNLTMEELRALLDAAELTFANGFWVGTPLFRWAHKRIEEREKQQKAKR